MNIYVKRAGFRWGIGRELYSSPFTFAKVETKKNDRGKWELANAFAKFSVSHIAYNEDRKITELIIVDNTGTEVFRQTGKPAKAPASKPATVKKPEPVITSDASGDSPPFDVPEQDGITQAMLTKAGQAFLKDMSQEQKTLIAADIKKITGGSANYKSVGDPQIRQKLYDYFTKSEAKAS